MFDKNFINDFLFQLGRVISIPALSQDLLSMTIKQPDQIFYICAVQLILFGQISYRFTLLPFMIDFQSLFIVYFGHRKSEPP